MHSGPLGSNSHICRTWLCHIVGMLFNPVRLIILICKIKNAALAGLLSISNYLYINKLQQCWMLLLLYCLAFFYPFLPSTLPNLLFVFPFHRVFSLYFFVFDGSCYFRQIEFLVKYLTKYLNKIQNSKRDLNYFPLPNTGLSPSLLLFLPPSLFFPFSSYPLSPCLIRKQGRYVKE